jgi:hypothetical protein
VFQAAELIAGRALIKGGTLVMVICRMESRISEVWNAIYAALPTAALEGAYKQLSAMDGARLILVNGSCISVHLASHAKHFTGKHPDLLYLDSPDIKEEHMENIRYLAVSGLFPMAHGPPQEHRVVTMIGHED